LHDFPEARITVTTLAMKVPDDFPLSGKDLKKVLEELYVVRQMVNDPEGSKAWFKTHKTTAQNLGKLLDWSEKQK